MAYSASGFVFLAFQHSGAWHIKPEDVINEPDLAELWSEIFPLLDGKCIIAHNAPFDIGVLRATMREYMLDEPEADYMCTVQISRKVWPQLPNHKLNTLASYFDIQFRHHNALDDAIVCAHIAIEAGEKKSATSLKDLSQTLRIVSKKL